MSRKEEVEEIKKKRFRFLSACYEESGADPYKVLPTYTIAGDRSFEHNLADKIVRYLEQEELVEVSGRGHRICITHKGIREVEQALSKPDAPTEYFPAGCSIYARNIIHSQIQQASPGATQLELGEGKGQKLKELVESLKESVDKLGLQQEQQTDLLAQIRTMDAQMSSSSPIPSIISESLRTTRRILEEAAGGALAVGFIETIKTLLAG